MKPVKKAYRLNPSKVKENWFYSDFVVYANDEKEARYKILGDYRRYDIELESGEELSYITAPAIRDKNHDLFLYDGKELTHNQIAQEEAEKARLKVMEDILTNNLITHCYIIKRGTYYRDGYCGYTEFRSQAGIYPKSDAVKHAKGCRDVKVLPIDNDDHNKALREEIEQIKNRLITS